MSYIFSSVLSIFLYIRIVLLSNLYYDKESGSDEWEKYQQEKYEESQKGVKENEKFLAEQEEIAAEATKDPVTVCMNHDGEWTHDGTCKFKDGVEMDKPYSKEQYQADFEHYMEEEGVWDEYAEQQNKDRNERAEMTQSKTFEKFVKSKGIDYDDDYDWLSVDEQLAIESEFREYDPDEYAEEINNKKDKKEPVPVIEDWQNEVTTTDEQIKETAQEISEGEEWNNYPITQTPTNEEESSEEEQEKINAEAQYQQEKYEKLSEPSIIDYENIKASPEITYTSEEEESQQEQQEESVEEEEPEQEVEEEEESGEDESNESEEEDSSDSESEE